MMQESDLADLPHVAMILTRDIDAAGSFGRVKILQSVRDALRDVATLKVFTICTILDERSVQSFARATWRAVESLLVGRPLPLQVVLYASNSAHRVPEALGTPSAIYMDTVRTVQLLSQLKQQLPSARFIVDFDDLMSRRMELLLRRRLPLSLGFVGRKMPGIFAKLIAGPLAQLVLRYETRTLRLAEATTLRQADAVVLISDHEANELRLRHPKWANKVHAVPPPAALLPPIAMPMHSLRFIFVGSDILTQNRLAIDVLIGLWRRHRFAHQLHIYGQQTRPLPKVPGIVWHGFVDNISDAYLDGSIMLLPSPLGGGVKTKVVEAWSRSCPVLGNALAFEGIGIQNYPLQIEPDSWTPLLSAPMDFLDTWKRAGSMGREYVASELNPERFVFTWRNLVGI